MVARENESGAANSADRRLALVESAIQRYGLYGNSAQLCGFHTASSASDCISYSSSPPLSALFGWKAPVHLPLIDPTASRTNATQNRKTVEAGLQNQQLHRRRRVALLGGSFSPPTLGHMSVALEVLSAVDARTFLRNKGATAGSDQSTTAALHAVPDADEQNGHHCADSNSKVVPSDDGYDGSVCDEVWVVPCGPRPDKPSLDVHPLQRHAMTLLAVEASFPPSLPIKVAPLELWQPQAVPSYTLLSSLSAAYPDVDFRLIIGADLLPDLHKWRHAQRLLRQVHFLLVPRPGFDIDSNATNISGSSSDGGNIPPPTDDAILTSPLHLTPLCRRDGSAIETVSVSSSQVRQRLQALLVARGPTTAADVDGHTSEAGNTDSSKWTLAYVQGALEGLVPPPVAHYVWAQQLYCSPAAASSSPA